MRRRRRRQPCPGLTRSPPPLATGARQPSAPRLRPPAALGAQPGGAFTPQRRPGAAFLRKERRRGADVLTDRWPEESKTKGVSALHAGGTAGSRKPSRLLPCLRGAAASPRNPAESRVGHSPSPPGQEPARAVPPSGAWGPAGSPRSRRSPGLSGAVVPTSPGCGGRTRQETPP